MLRSVSTKIFLCFLALSSLETLVLTWTFSRLIIRDKETYLLESLLMRAQLKAASTQTKSNSKIYKVYPNDSLQRSELPENFTSMLLLPLLPPHGSSVTPCKDNLGKSYFCAFVKLQEANYWSFDFVPLNSTWQVSQKILGEMITLAFLWVLLSAILAYLLTRILFSPVHSFLKMSESISSGHYDQVPLPVERKDEIGDLARSFQKMIDGIKRREEKIVHSTRLASVGQMGASIAHEVKNPLMSISGHAKLIAKKIADPELKESAEIVEKETERCTQIIQQMLRFSRSDPDESKHFNIQEVIQSTLLLLRVEAKSKRIKIISDEVCPSIVKGSPLKIQQVLMNLVMNAIQASPENTEVHIRGQEVGPVVIVSVTDQGQGIPDELKNRIFDPFFTTKSKGQGTGLGLSVSQEIIHNHGGEISFSSAQGSGTTFRFSLPLS